MAPQSPSSGCPICGAALRPDPELARHAIARCEGCGVRLAPRRSEAEQSTLYAGDYFERYAGGAYTADHVRRRFEARRRLRLVQRHARGGSLLEIGCASGFFLDVARREGFTAVGVEPSAEMAELARERFGADVRTGMFADVEFERRSLDVVCAWHVVEHLVEPRRDLDRICDLLRPGGVLAVEVPNAAGRLVPRLGEAWPHWDFAHHEAHHTPRSLRLLLEGAGLRVVDLHTFPGTGYIPTARALHPRMAANLAVEAVRLRALPRRPHPTAHELIRAVARPRS